MGRMKEVSARLLPCEWEAITALHRLADQHPNETMRQLASQYAQQVENRAVERVMKSDTRVWTSRAQGTLP